MDCSAFHTNEEWIYRAHEYSIPKLDVLWLLWNILTLLAILQSAWYNKVLQVWHILYLFFSFFLWMYCIYALHIQSMSLHKTHLLNTMNTFGFPLLYVTRLYDNTAISFSQGSYRLFLKQVLESKTTMYLHHSLQQTVLCTRNLSHRGTQKP